MKTKKGKNLQSWLFALNGIFAIFSAVAVGAAIISLFRIQQEATFIYRQIEELEKVYQAQTVLQRIDLAQRILFDRFEDSGQISFKENMPIFNGFLEQTSLTVNTSQEDQIITNLQAEFQQYDQLYSEILVEYEKGQENIDKQNYQNLRGEMNDSLETMHQSTQELVHLNVNATTDANERVSSLLEKLLQAGLGGLALFILMAIIIAVLISVRVYQPILVFEDAIKALRQDRFAPSQLDKLTSQNNEMGKLSQAFINMAKSIDSRNNELLTRKQELEKELADN